MSAKSSKLTVDLDEATISRLEELAENTGQTKSLLVSKALADYVEQELAIVAGIKRGLADIRAGRVTPHEVAKQRIRDTIQRARSE